MHQDGKDVLESLLMISPVLDALFTTFPPLALPAFPLVALPPLPNGKVRPVRRGAVAGAAATKDAEVARRTKAKNWLRILKKGYGQKVQ